MELIINSLRFSYSSVENMTGFVLPEINALFQSQKMHMIIGEPATGKTTLARVLTGQLPNSLTGTLKGQIIAGNQEISTLSAGERMTLISMAGQNADEQIITNRCDEEIVFALESLGMPPAEMKKKLTKSAAALEIGDLVLRSPQTLSGGEKKKLVIAALLALDPAIYVLDEALEEIAPQTRISILTALKEKKRTILFFVSRFHSEYVPLCDTFSVLTEQGFQQTASLPEIMPLLERKGLILQKRSFQLPEYNTKNIILESTDIQFRYSGNQQFFLSVPKFRLYSGEIAAFVGDNGSGKSTFAKIMCGLLQPAKGDVRIADKKQKTSNLPRQVGYIFQNPDYQLFLATIKDEVFAASKQIDLDSIIKMFSLPAPESPAALLSYGTRKRLQCAVFFSLKRDICILDEADAGLSPEQIITIIHTFSRQNTAIIFITHDLEFANKAAHRVIQFKQGRIQ